MFVRTHTVRAMLMLMIIISAGGGGGGGGGAVVIVEVDVVEAPYLSTTSFHHPPHDSTSLCPNYQYLHLICIYMFVVTDTS